jgi:hypothetical protein
MVDGWIKLIFGAQFIRMLLICFMIGYKSEGLLAVNIET